MTKVYNEKKIKVLNEIQHVRLRPHVYVGDTKQQEVVWPTLDDSGNLQFTAHHVSPGYMTCIREITDNVLDIIRHTSVGGKCWVDFDQKTCEFTIRDNSVGVPVGKHETGPYTPEVVFGGLRSGKNFEAGEELNIGMNGMGASLTNFFSHEFSVTIYRDLTRYYQEWKDAVVSAPVIKPVAESTCNANRGTQVKFRLDSQYFHGFTPSLTLVKDYITLIARLNPDVDFIFNDEKVVTKGIKDFAGAGKYYRNGKWEVVVVPTCVDTYQAFSSCNGVPTLFGGTHLEYFENTLVDVTRGKLKLKETIHKANILTGLQVILACREIPDVAFDSQAKSRLTTDTMDKHLKSLPDAAGKFLKEEADGWLTWIEEKFERKQVAKKLKAKKATTRQNKVYPPKTWDDAELYIVEGDSALSNFLAVRRHNQGVLTLRGKILNVAERKLSEAVESDTIVRIIETLGIKLDEAADCKFKRIVIATDADSDGLHIQGLLINLLYHLSPDLLDRLYILESPLYIATKGKQSKTYYTKEQFKADDTKGMTVRYNKGLGSLTKADWDNLANPATRSLVNLQVGDLGGHELTQTIVRLFGKDVTSRKVWLAGSQPIYSVVVP